jgi:hypothetical protein
VPDDENNMDCLLPCSKAPVIAQAIASKPPCWVCPRYQEVCPLCSIVSRNSHTDSLGLRKHANRPFASSKKSTYIISSNLGMAIFKDVPHALEPLVASTKDAVESTVTEIAENDSSSAGSEQHIDALTVVQPIRPLPRRFGSTKTYVDSRKT